MQATQNTAFTTLDINPVYLPKITNSLQELGISIAHISYQQGFFFGVGLRVHFSRPVPESFVYVISQTKPSLDVHEN